MKKGKYVISPFLFITFLCFLGFLLGVLTIALWNGNWLISKGILNPDCIREVTALNVDKRALFFLCFERRMRAFFLLFLLSFSSINNFTNLTFFLFSSFYVGSVMEILAVRYGMQGIMMYLTMVFPQGLFYILGFVILGCWCFIQESAEGKVNNRKIQKIRKIRNKKAVCISWILVFIGIIVESYINPEIFFFFLKNK